MNHQNQRPVKSFCGAFFKKRLAEGTHSVIDCQASGANPEKGHLMELAWKIGDTLKSYYIQLPESAEIPRRITRITGISAEDLNEKGVSEKEVWNELIDTLRHHSNNESIEQFPAIIHFSRYEEPFLHHLHQTYSSGTPFPFKIICTHRLVQRLLPGLPSKGLRAIAGYFGHSVPEFRRSRHHVEATAYIWEHLIELLDKQEGVRTWEELYRWLDKEKNSIKVKTAEREFPMPQAKRKQLPNVPGVYRMLRSNGDLLYIGKATSLKKRVNSYFHKKKRSAQARLTMEMLTQAADLDVTVTGSALEAALLESDEIKRHSPPYNVALREGERELVFWSRNLKHRGSFDEIVEIGEAYPVGPVPAHSTLPAFSALLEFLRGELVDLAKDEVDEEVCALVLGMPLEYVPPVDCFCEGVELFKRFFLSEGQGEAPPGPPTTLRVVGELDLRFFMKLGKELRRKRLAEMEAAALKDNEEEVEEDETVKERVWTPETVCQVLEGIVMHGAQLIRRARWFCVLMESALSWESGETSGRMKRYIVFGEGNILQQGEYGDIADEEPPVPPGYNKRITERQNHFDIMTYDRLRVLTTELRRLVTDKTFRNVQLRLKPDLVLTSSHLSRLFQWV